MSHVDRPHKFSRCTVCFCEGAVTCSYSIGDKLTTESPVNGAVVQFMKLFRNHEEDVRSCEICTK